MPKHRPTMIPIDVHSFSRSFAADHGATAAMLLKFIAYKVSRSQNKRDGRAWYFDSAKKISARFPYLSASTISSQVKSLEAKGLLEIGNYNLWKRDRTQWFHVTEEVAERVNADQISFDANAAKDHGVLAAVLHYNLVHFIRLRVKKKVKAKSEVKAPNHVMSPKLLATLLPFSESAIKKALKKLVDAGLIVKCVGSRATYTLPAADLLTLGQMR